MTEPPLVTNSEPTPTTEMHATEAIPEGPTIPQTPEIIFVKPHMSRLTPLPCPGAISGNTSAQLSPRCRQRPHPAELSPSVPHSSQMRLLPDVPQGDDNAPADLWDFTPDNGNAPRDVCETTHSIQEEDVSTPEVFDDVDALEHTDTDMADATDSAVTESKTLHFKEGGSYPFKYDAEVSKVGTQRFAGLGPISFKIPRRSSRS
ncbi:hypothetical protein E4U61_001148 [Claviceps capensis]|nr:hypothetical protein E4U61_001148 [Claviceps capensis]